MAATQPAHQRAAPGTLAAPAGVRQRPRPVSALQLLRLVHPLLLCALLALLLGPPRLERRVQCYATCSTKPLCSLDYCTTTTAINLAATGLYGTIPSSLTHLTNLATFNVANIFRLPVYSSTRGVLQAST